MSEQVSVAFIFCLFPSNAGNISFVCITSPMGVTLVFFGLKTVGEGMKKILKFLNIPSKNTGFSFFCCFLIK